ncbi:MAG: hypothetical protein ACQESG_06870 [Nanobdellota archaeon]
MKDNQQPKAIASLILTFVFGILAIVGLVSFDALGGVAGALFLVSLLLSMTSFVCIFIFRKRSHALQKIFGKESRIFHYPKKEWQEYLKHEYGLRAQEKKAMFIFLSAITAVIFLIFIAVINEARLAMFLVMVALLGLYGTMAFVGPRLMYRFRSETGEIGILDTGVIVNGTLHSWDLPRSKLGSVKEKRKPFHHYQISYEFVDRLGPRSYVIRIPFPKEAQAFREAIKALR